ncbi:acetyl-CoA C-acetyltransferase [Allomyces macrogynus ATCC 38327]|uniref:acetyl-CoA C-acetyltransferase n=1 Tax=Allomyces macrogynus (strain ATCC 38327) TaxID=578462 RepID=A0A0L0SLH9_ALLM3|nr:acetyl-CoA C-acetyltransferase [Allomyces macrogynus ATCC 38327]|eukprot:KNE63406.1 acetyl-CoA C-acetyltransferase [Allomyces macrogynus ATCC 38327]
MSRPFTPLAANNVNDKDVFILAAVRTPIGSYNGSLASLNAIELGTHVVKGALAKADIPSSMVDEFYFGNVVSAGNGQNPARQVAVHAGIPITTPATTINKVCASGMKAIALAAQSIRLGETHCAIAGGTESMSHAPHLLPKARFGVKYGHTPLLDSLVTDGLSDAFGKYSMGIAAEATVRDFGFTREQQDDHAVESYTRAQAATKAGLFAPEMIPVEVTVGKTKKVVTTDDEVKNVNPTKMRSLKPSFDPKGSVTAANSSPLSDGAAAVVLVSGKRLRGLLAEGKVKSGSVVFRVLANADAEQEPIKFTTTPAVAVPRALAKAGFGVTDVDYFEFNEAFSCVALANTRILNLDPERVNVLGGAVALGHPLGCSGARIVATLCNVLNHKNARLGCAGICNGGGGASAVVVERVLLGAPMSKL